MNVPTVNINIVDERANFNEVIWREYLTKRCPDGNILAADQLDLRVHSVGIFGLSGPNNAGKTTTLGMLTAWPGRQVVKL